MPRQRTRHTFALEKIVYGSRFAVIVGQNRAVVLFRQGQSAVNIVDGLREFVPAVHIGIELRQ